MWTDAAFHPVIASIDYPDVCNLGRCHSKTKRRWEGNLQQTYHETDETEDKDRMPPVKMEMDAGEDGLFGFVRHHGFCHGSVDTELCIILGLSQNACFGKSEMIGR